MQDGGQRGSDDGTAGEEELGGVGMVSKQYARMQKLALKDQLRGIVDL